MADETKKWNIDGKDGDGNILTLEKIAESINEGRPYGAEEWLKAEDFNAAVELGLSNMRTAGKQEDAFLAKNGENEGRFGEIDDALATKADLTYVVEKLNEKTTHSEVDERIDTALIPVKGDISGLKTSVEALKGAFVYIGRINAQNPTADQLQAAAEGILNGRALKSGYTLIDSDGVEWYWNENFGWTNLGQSVVSTATREHAGIVKASGLINRADVDVSGEAALNEVSLDKLYRESFRREVSEGDWRATTVTEDGETYESDPYTLEIPADEHKAGEAFVLDFVIGEEFTLERNDEDFEEADYGATADEDGNITIRSLFRFPFTLILYTPFGDELREFMDAVKAGGIDRLAGVKRLTDVDLRFILEPGLYVYFEGDGIADELGSGELGWQAYSEGFLLVAPYGVDDECVTQRNFPFDYPRTAAYERLAPTHTGYNPQPWSLGERPLYSDSLLSSVGNATDLPMTQKAVTDALAGKLDKVAWTGNYSRVYGINGSGEQVVYQGTPIAASNSVVMRSSNGTTQFTIPQVGSDAANKTYVDSTVSLEQERAISEELALAVRIAAQEGLGGYLPHYDFGAAAPEQDDLTDYALGAIPLANPADIFNGTRVENDFDGQTWVLVNTPDTEPPVFSWEPMSGSARVAPFTNAAAGVIKGSSADGGVGTQPDGTGRVNGWDALSDAANTALSMAEAASTEVTQEAARAIGREDALEESLETEAARATAAEQDNAGAISTANAKLATIQSGAEVNPDILTVSDGQAGTSTAQRAINAANLKNIILYHSPAGARAASDVYAWAKAMAKPAYSFSEITGAAGSGQLPIAGSSPATKGAVYQGDNITIDAAGMISANFGTVAPYIQTIAWSGSVGGFSYTRTAAQHGKGTNPDVRCFRNGVIADCEPYVAANGDITVYSNANIAGMAIEIR